MAKKLMDCCAVGHNYTVVADADTRKTAPDGATEIWRTLYCTKCGEILEFKAAVWAKRNYSNYDKTTGEKF